MRYKVTIGDRVLAKAIDCDTEEVAISRAAELARDADVGQVTVTALDVDEETFKLIELNPLSHRTVTKRAGHMSTLVTVVAP